MPNAYIRPLQFAQSGLSRKEWKILKRLSNPKKIQDFLNVLAFNFEKKGETNMSVREVLRQRQAHCFEGALLAATALWMRGHRPLLLDLKTVRPDFDHVVTLFKIRGSRGWGAISKTNHAVLRYREPIYRDARELALSYFHEYFLPDGKKTLRSFSKPFDLSSLGMFWLTTEENLVDLAHRLNDFPHTKILSPKKTRNLRKADKLEIKAGQIEQYKS